MNAFWAVVKKELNSVLRDRTMVIAILIQLFIASFSSVLLIGMLSLYDLDTIGQYGSPNVSVGLVGDRNGAFTGLLGSKGIRTSVYSSMDEARTAFSRGYVNSILVVPEPSESGVAEVKMYLPTSESSASSIRMTLQTPLKEYENLLRAQRGVTIRYTDLTGKPATSFEFIYSVILPMLMFFPAFVAGSMVIDAISEEVEGNTLQTMLSVPLSLNGLVGAKITSALILALVQCLAWLGLLRLNQISVQNPGWVLLLAMCVAGITTCGAGLVAAWFKDRERSQFVYSLFLLVAASLSYFFNISPLMVLSRLAIGDVFTHGWSLLPFAVVVAGLLLFLMRSTRRLQG